ncbi:hypothetical protein BR93DRAFT_186370 [Coniochaeta sp. PMI_546]|nr:hypothetical protein BR93DRAFT_186370 [Coniochaeta sp. PMI_546]
MVQRFFLSFYFRVEDIEDEAGVVLEEVARARDIDLSSFLRPFQDIWTRETRACYCPSTDELAAMLLSCLPNLSTLYLSSRSPWSAIPKSALSAAGVSNLSLRTIDVCGDQYDAHYRLSGILEMSASTLRTLNIDLYDSFDGRGMSICPLPNLRSISLTRSTISEPDLEALLSCCIGLEVFVHDAISDRDHILLSDLIRCLSKHKETLTTLHLNIRNVHVPNWDVLPSLRDFPILRAVLLNSAFIYHNTEDSSGDYGALTQLLPSSIVSLRLEIIPSAEICGRLARGLFGVSAATCQGRFPNLKMVKCYTAERLADDDLSEKFASTGVDFTYDARPDNSLFNL